MFFFEYSVCGNIFVTGGIFSQVLEATALNLDKP